MKVTLDIPDGIVCGFFNGVEITSEGMSLVRFTRRNYENISEKANVLTTMLNNPKIAPVLAFIHCGMFSDPQVAYKMSMEYVAEQEANAY